MSRIIFRICVFILLLLSLLFPWWVTLALSLVPLARYSFYAEILFLGFAFDALYSGAFFSFPHFPFGIFVAYTLLLFSFFLKKYLRVTELL